MKATIERRNPRTEPFIDLVGDLRDDIKRLVLKEIELAKAEMSEKFKLLGRNAVIAAAGAVTGLFAGMMGLFSLAIILGYLFTLAGLPQGVAYFVAFFGLFLVLAVTGFVLLQKAMHAFSKVSLAPDKTLDTIRGHESVPIEIKKSQPKDKKSANSGELKQQVEKTRERTETEMDELKSRLTPGYMAKSAVAGAKHHPVTTLLVSAGTGLGVGGYLYWRSHHNGKPHGKAHLC